MSIRYVALGAFVSLLSLLSCSSSGAPGSGGGGTATSDAGGGEGGAIAPSPTDADAAPPFEATLESCLRDCENPACAALVACVAMAPFDPGWEGPVEVYQGSSDPPACDAAFSGKVLEGGTNPTGAPFTCATPTCTLQGGSCVADPEPAPTLAPLAWSTRVKTCQAPMGGFACSKGVCVPRPSAAFRPKVCVVNGAGEVDCPLGSPYTDRLVLAASFADARHCSDPICSPDGVGGCVGTAPAPLYQVMTSGTATVCCLP